MTCNSCEKDLSNVSHVIVDYKEKYPLLRHAHILKDAIPEMDVKHYCIECDLLLSIDIKQMTIH